MAETNNDLNRAAQFLPFDSLKGLTEELNERIARRTRVERRELSDEDKEEISTALRSVDVGDRVKLVFYYNGNYVELNGAIEVVDSLHRCLVIDGSKIRYDDVALLKIL